MSRFLRLPYIKRMISVNALRKGLMGGSPFWRAIWFVLTARRLWSKVSKKGEAPVTFTEPLPEGEAWTVVHVPEKSRRGAGKGRKLAVGPKRAAPRVTRAVGPIVAEIARSALAAPPVDSVAAVDETARRSKRSRKQAKADAKQAKPDRKQAKADAKQAQADTHAKPSRRQAKATATGRRSSTSEPMATKNAEHSLS